MWLLFLLSSQASADKLVRVMRLPVSKHKGAGSTFMGHNAAVTCLGWSAQSAPRQLLISGSADRTARLWARACGRAGWVGWHARR